MITLREPARRARQRRSGAVAGRRGDEGERTRAELKGLAGDQFDRKFLAAQIEDHSKDIEKFSQAADRGSEGASRFASETLPILRQHLALARAVQTQLKAAE